MLIDELLEELGDKHMAEIIDRECDAALEDLPFKEITISNREEYMNVLPRLVRIYLDKIKHLYVAGTSIQNTEWIMKKIFSDNRQAFEYALSSDMYSIMSKINEYTKNTFTTTYRSSRLGTYPLSERLPLLKAYLQKYGHLLPGEYRGEQAEVLFTKFKEILLHHVMEIEPGIRATAERG